MTERSYTGCRFSDLSYRCACSWESALFKGPDDFNGCGYFHVSLLLIALRHICRWFEEDLGSEFVLRQGGPDEDAARC